MSIQREDIDHLLNLDKIKADEKNAHIIIDPDQCASCQAKPCLIVCPALLYTLDEIGTLNFDYAGCLECGTCRTICPHLKKWEYPRHTFGIYYRQG